MRRIRLMAVIVLAAHLPACSSYQLIADPAESLQPAPDTPKKVRVTLADGRQYPVTTPIIYADSLRGISYQKKPVSFAMADITKVEIPKPSTGKSIGLGLGIAAAVGIIVGLVLLHNADFWVPQQR